MENDQSEKPVESNDDEKRDDESSSDGYETPEQRTPESSERMKSLSPKNSENTKTPDSSKKGSPGKENTPDSTSGKLKRRNSESPESSGTQRSVRRRVSFSRDGQSTSTSNVVQVPAEIPQNSENRNPGIVEAYSVLSIFHRFRVVFYFNFISILLSTFLSDLRTYFRRWPPRVRSLTSLVPTISIDLSRLLRSLFFNNFSISIFVWVMLTILNSGIQLQLTFLNFRGNTPVVCAVPVHYLGENLLSIPLWNGAEYYFGDANFSENFILRGTTRRLFSSDPRMLSLFGTTCIPLHIMGRTINFMAPTFTTPRIMGSCIQLLYQYPNQTSILQRLVEDMFEIVDQLRQFFVGSDDLDDAFLSYYNFPPGSE